MTIQFTEQYSGKNDRSAWKRGQWDAEPLDKAVWVHNGYDCMIKRNSYGAWCGYVAVKQGHKLFGANYCDVSAGIECLTYSDECYGDICHMADDGNHVWWFGIDAAHGYNDYPSEWACGTHYCTQIEMVQKVCAMAEDIENWELWEDMSEDDD